MWNILAKFDKAQSTAYYFSVNYIIHILLQCCGGTIFLNLRFENGVILYGSQTDRINAVVKSVFENGVILYGSQTTGNCTIPWGLFENGVILYGSQTKKFYEYDNIPVWEWCNFIW